VWVSSLQKVIVQSLEAYLQQSEQVIEFSCEVHCTDIDLLMIIFDHGDVHRSVVLNVKVATCLVR